MPVENVRLSELLSGVQRDAYLQAGDVVRVSEKPVDAPAPAPAPAAATKPAAAAEVAPPWAGVIRGSRLEELILRRRNLALQIELLSGQLGSAHPQRKSAEAQLAKLDKLVAAERAVIARMSPEQIAARDATTRELRRQLAEMELNVERLRRSVGPSHPFYLDAARNIELQRQRIRAHERVWREAERAGDDADVM
jgi:hypothetical protein